MTNTTETLTVTINEAARRLSVSPGTIKNLVFTGKLRSVKILRRRLIVAEDLRTLIGGIAKEPRDTVATRE
jgi:excisionase family DNA binding protein